MSLYNKFKIIKKSIFVFLFLVISFSISYAGQTVPTKINNIESYLEYGGGDITFKVDDPDSGCIAYWLSPNDAGFYTNYGVLLSAFNKQSTVSIQSKEDQLWAGSGAKYCKVYLISIMR